MHPLYLCIRIVNACQCAAPACISYGPHILLAFQDQDWVSRWALFLMKKCCKPSHQTAPPLALWKKVKLIRNTKKLEKCYMPLCREAQLTPLSRVNDDNFAEWPVSLIVVDSNLHFKRSQWGESLISVLIHGWVCWSHHLFLPASGSIGTKGNDVPEAFAILELLRHRLETFDRWFYCDSERTCSGDFSVIWKEPV